MENTITASQCNSTFTEEEISFQTPVHENNVNPNPVVYTRMDSLKDINQTHPLNIEAIKLDCLTKHSVKEEKDGSFYKANEFKIHRSKRDSLIVTLNNYVSNMMEGAKRRAVNISVHGDGRELGFIVHKQREASCLNRNIFCDKKFLFFFLCFVTVLTLILNSFYF